MKSSYNHQIVYSRRALISIQSQDEVENNSHVQLLI